MLLFIQANAFCPNTIDQLTSKKQDNPIVTFDNICTSTFLEADQR